MRFRPDWQTVGMRSDAWTKLDYLTQSLKGVVENIKEKSAQVMDAANVLDSDATETSTTMEQVEQAVNDIAEGATTQAGETQRAEEQVIEMGNMVQETSDEVEKLLAFAQDMHDCTAQASQILKALEQVMHVPKRILI